MTSVRSRFREQKVHKIRKRALSVVNRVLPRARNQSPELLRHVSTWMLQAGRLVRRNRLARLARAVSCACRETVCTVLERCAENPRYIVLCLRTNSCAVPETTWRCYLPNTHHLSLAQHVRCLHAIRARARARVCVCVCVRV